MAKNPLLDEGAREGIWYLVWLKPRWQVVIDNTGMNHYDLWQHEIIPVLKKHYKLSKNEAAELSMYHAGMPRGRIIQDSPDRWLAGHGGDWPAGVSEEAVLKGVYGKLGLSKQAMLGQIDAGEVVHETMDLSEQEAVQDIIGRIPF